MVKLAESNYITPLRTLVQAQALAGQRGFVVICTELAVDSTTRHVRETHNLYYTFSHDAPRQLFFWIRTVFGYC